MTSWKTHGLSDVSTAQEVLLKLGRGLEGVNVLEIQKYLRESKVRSFFSVLRTNINTLARLRRRFPCSASISMLRTVPRVGVVMCSDVLQTSNIDSTANAQDPPYASNPPLYTIQNFIAALAEANDGEFAE